MLNRSIAPLAQGIKNLELVHPESIKYANGLETFLFHTDDLELMKFEFVFENKYDVSRIPLLNVALSSMFKEGTTTRTSAQIAEEIDFYGAYLMPEYSFDYTSLTLYTIRKHVAKVLPIMADILSNTMIPQEELDTYVRNNKQNLQIALQKNDVVVRRLFYNNLFGDNQYGALAKAEDYDAIKREDLLQIFKEQIQPSNCTLLIAGKIDKSIKDLVQVLFGESWQGAVAAISKPILLSEPTYGKLLLETREDALQSAIRLGGYTVGRTHSDFPAIQFVNMLLGGFFGSRLMRNIREDKGYTYSIGSTVVSLKHTAFMTLSSEVGVDVTKATLVEIEREFKHLSEELATDAEVDLVRNYMLGSLLGSLESIFSHVDKFKAVHFSGLDLGYYRHYQDVIRDMTPDRVQEIAVQYFDYDRMVKAIVGKY